MSDIEILLALSIGGAALLLIVAAVLICLAIDNYQPRRTGEGF